MCEDCPLRAEKESSYVPSFVGKNYWGGKKIVFLGEAPGAAEVEQKTPFVGQSGKLLFDMLHALRPKILRDDVALVNVCRCRPPQNRTPTDEEVRACAPLLEQELRELEPDLVVALGNTAVRSLLGTALSPLQGGGEIFYSSTHGVYVVAAYHPAFVLRRRSMEPFFVWQMTEVLQKLRRLEPFVELPYEVRVVEEGSFEEALEALEAVYGVEEAAFDLETTAFDFLRDSILCISFAYREGAVDVGVTIPLLGHKGKKIWSLEQDRLLKRRIKEVLEDPRKQWIAHNGAFDLRFLRRRGVKVKLRWDTMLLQHLWNEKLPLSLEFCSTAYPLGIQKDKKSVYSYLKSRKESFALVPPQVLRTYAAKDSLVTLRLKRFLVSKISSEKMKIHDRITLPLSQIFAEVSYEGVKLDEELLDMLCREFDKRVAEELAELKSIAGETFNPRSTKQLQALLFEKLKLPFHKRTKGGSPSVDRESLEALRGRHVIVDKLLEYRADDKIRSTFLEGLKARKDGKGRIHSTYSVAGTETGRLSSRDPNLQNIPRKTRGEEIRGLFIPSSRDKCFVNVDYSQMELRVLAHVSRDPELCRIFRAGEDVHTMTAISVLGVGEEQAREEQNRIIAKQINFGIVYGGGSNILVKRGMEEGKAKEYLRNYFRKFSGVYEYQRKVEAQLRARGRIANIFGRERSFPGIFSQDKGLVGEAVRGGINFVIQSSAADILSRTTVLLFSALERFGRGARILLTLHDSLSFEVERSALDEFKALVREYFIDKWRNIISVPLVAEIAWGERWGSYQQKQELKICE